MVVDVDDLFWIFVVGDLVDYVGVGVLVGDVVI